MKAFASVILNPSFHDTYTRRPGRGVRTTPSHRSLSKTLNIHTHVYYYVCIVKLGSWRSENVSYLWLQTGKCETVTKSMQYKNYYVTSSGNLYFLPCSVYSDSLRAARSGIESRWGRDFPPVKTVPGAHPASCKMGTRSFPGGKVRPGRAAEHSPPSSAAVMEE